MCDNSVKHTSENGDGMEKEELLQRVFGYSNFRPGQEKLIDGVLSGQDVFGIMPTGGGKSICYQLPALMLPGITLVISPLISLMRDQVMALKGAGVPAAFLNSTLTGPQMQAAYRNLLAGRYKIVYVAPERLDYPGFGGVVEKLNISFIAVDEAHCISQWGQDFRPSYLRIVQFIDSLPKRPVVGAFTATATRSVQEDVERILELRSPVREVTGFDRPNLYFEVIQPESKDKTLLRLLAGQKRKSGIIYCATRKKVESVCELLCDHGYAATRYHAGLSEAERSKNQEDFLYDRKTVMVATNAFGMGIDKSNVSFVIHYNMPKSIEAYYQEAGRAGRDGARRRTAFCCSTPETCRPPGSSSTTAPTTRKWTPCSGRRCGGRIWNGWTPWSPTARRKAACGATFWITSGKSTRRCAATAAAARGISSRWTSPGKRRSFSPA